MFVKQNFGIQVQLKIQQLSLYQLVHFAVRWLISPIVRVQIFIPQKRLLKHNQTYMSGSFMLCAVRKSIKAAEFHHFPPCFRRCGGNVK
jgi:hypothetical protein